MFYAVDKLLFHNYKTIKLAWINIKSEPNLLSEMFKHQHKFPKVIDRTDEFRQRFICTSFNLIYQVQASTTIFLSMHTIASRFHFTLYEYSGSRRWMHMYRMYICLLQTTTVQLNNRIKYTFIYFNLSIYSSTILQNPSAPNIYDNRI